MRIIQFGYGTVGKSFAQLVSHRDDLHIESIGVRASKPREGDFEFTTEVNELLKSGNADVFVELTDDPEFSWKVALAAAERGIPLVTANKAMVAQNLNDLQSLKSDNKLKLLYESSCAGAIPIIRTLDQYHRLGVQKVEGILNGSCNYILDRIFSKGDSFEDALEQAQQAGYAESNPSLDLSGKDAAYKLSILIDKAYGVKVQDSDLLLSGID
ncbi:MAG: hypothetical protein HRT74_05610 [Flavobacteriales bacterium]|nr:hypothetical protein [Flavobacteriales bacterium]